MVLVEGTLQNPADSAPAEADGEPKSDAEPYMRHRLRDRVSFWREIGACDMVLGWIEYGFMAIFGTPCEGWVKTNQPCCFDPPEHPKFISESVAMLLRRGVIREWDPSWGKPKVVSPLKVVPKKGNKYRLILDLSKLNKHLLFPRFKYDSIAMVAEVFDLDDWLFAFDMKDGYWHCDLHSDMWEYMCFEWEGVIYTFVQLPFGCAPACWVFTKLIKVMVAFWRGSGLKILSYIDDGLAGAASEAEAKAFSDLVIDTLVRCGWIVNWAKSSFEPSQREEFIGYQVSTALPAGSIQLSESRWIKLVAAVDRFKLKSAVCARDIARVAGYIVSARPVFDPMALLFTREMYVWVQGMVDSRGWDWRAGKSEGLQTELLVWAAHLAEWKVRPLFNVTAEPDMLMAQDASDRAVGGFVGSIESVSDQVEPKGRVIEVCHPVIASCLEGFALLPPWERCQSSTYRELWAVWFMFSTFAERLRGCVVRVQVDNQAVYYLAIKGKSSVTVLHELLVKVFWLCKAYGIKWEVVWVPREWNQVADDISKWYDPDDWCLNPHHWAVVCARFGPFDCDCFASSATALMPCYCAVNWCPGVWYVDCFTRSWSAGVRWWNPNPRDVGRVLLKVLRDGAVGSLLLPVWPAAWWWRRLCPDGKHFGAFVTDWLELPRQSLFVIGEGDGLWNKKVPRTRMVVVRLDGRLGSFGLGARLGFCSSVSCALCGQV